VVTVTPMKIEVLTLFPEFVEQVGRYGIVRRAVESGKLALTTRDATCSR
jgi:tRNA (guanine37-N1)-methyltransferase